MMRTLERFYLKAYEEISWTILTKLFFHKALGLNYLYKPSVQFLQMSICFRPDFNIFLNFKADKLLFNSLKELFLKFPYE